MNFQFLKMLAKLCLLFMVFANLHGYGVDEANLARIDLGQRRFEQYTKARRIYLRTNQVPEADGDNDRLPLKKANNKYWDDEARLVFHLCESLKMTSE